MNARYLNNLRKICLALPDAIEDEKWGNPHFCVNKKIFAGCGDEGCTFTVGCKLEMGHARRIIGLPGFTKAPYVGHKGWVSIDLSIVKDWKLIEELVMESYQLIGPKKSLEKMNDLSAVARKTDRVAVRKKK